MVSVSGLVTALTAGITTISAASEGASGTAAITVTAARPGAVSDLSVVSVSQSSVTLQFTEVDDGTGQPARYDVRFEPAPISWGSAPEVSQGTCATPVEGTSIGATRLCTVEGLSAGTTYEFQLVPYRGELDVNAVFGPLSNVAQGTTEASVAAVASVTVSPSSADAYVGQTVQLTATLRDADGSVLTGRVVTWASSDPAVATVSSSGVASGKAVGTVTITATREGKQGAAAVSVSEWTGNADYPNEPTGFTPIFEHALDAIPSSSNGILGNWRSTPSGQPNFSIVADADAPFGPNVLDIKYRAGMRAGDSPGKFFISGSFPGFSGDQGYEEIYYSHYVKLVGSDWEQPPANQKLFYSPRGTGGKPFLGLRSTTGSGGSGALVADFPFKWSMNNAPIFSSGRAFKVGQWHHIELYMKHSTIDVADGIVKVWLDGALQINDTAYLSRFTGAPRGPGGWNDYEFTPVYGGTGWIKVREDHIRVDHVYCSGKGLLP